MSDTESLAAAHAAELNTLAVPVDPASGAPATKRKGSSVHSPRNWSINATHLPEPAWAVAMAYLLPVAGSINHYLTPAEARQVAAALIVAADHYDAETERLQAAGARA